MGISRALIDQEELFHSMSGESIIVNDFNVNSQEEKEKLNNLIMTRYDGDSLDVLPSCDCGGVVGEYNVGVTCGTCRTKCASVTERPLESALWLTPPKGVHTLINPSAWIFLTKKFTFNGYNLIEWLCNPYYKTPSSPVPPKIRELKALNLPRGLNNFYEHFDTIMAALYKADLVQDGSKDRDVFWRWMKENRKLIFTRYIPIPSKLAFITESTSTGMYADTSMTPAIDAIRTISAIENSVVPVKLAKKESHSVKAIVKLAKYYHDFTSKQLGTKYGWFRKHVFGSRLHFSFRSVISSITDQHQYDELHLPWSLAVSLFEVHLTSKLLKHGYTPNETMKFLRENTNQYHPFMDELFKELIAEGPESSIPSIFQRNPSLVRGSAQCLRITKIKTNPADNTVGLSVLVLASLNADFDGDALNGIIQLDLKMNKKLSRLKPHHYVLDLTSPRNISNYVKLPAPIISTVGNWLNDEHLRSLTSES